MQHHGALQEWPEQRGRAWSHYGRIRRHLLLDLECLTQYYAGHLAAYGLGDSRRPEYHQGHELYGGKMSEKAVIDRFEEGLAVLIICEADAERQVNMPRKALPRGAKEGHWLQVEMEGDQAKSAAIDKEETARARARIMEKLQRLRSGDYLKDEGQS